MRWTLLATLLVSCLGWAHALGEAFACPEFRYPTLRSHDLGPYRLTEHGPDHNRPDYVLQVDLEHAEGARWCFVADLGRIALVGGGEIREPIDLTGNGLPDVVIQVLGFRNSCDESVYVLELAAEPRFLYRAESNLYSDREDALDSVCRVTITDLDGDGRYELLTHDSLWDNPRAATGDCSHAATPYLAIALAYREGAGYEAVDPYAVEPLLDPSFLRRLHTTNIANAMLRYLSALEKRPIGSFERDHHCAILAIILPIVYRGQVDFAREVLETLYLLDDTDAMWAHVVGLALASPYFGDAWRWMGP